jgi:ligand-binding sensor domain-containing protein
MPAETGIAKIEIRSGKTEYYFTSEKINAILYDTRIGLMMLGTGDGIIEWNVASNLSHRIKTLRSTALGKIICMATDKTFNQWIGTEEHGLFIISPGNIIAQMVKNSEQQNAINGNKINTIYCDNTGIVWVGVSTNGIDQLIPGNRFTHYSENLKAKNSLTNNVVRCFIEGANKNIWIATQGGGINIFNPSLRSFSSINKKNTPGLPFDFIRFMVKDEKDIAWIGTERGMCRIAMQSRKTDKINFTGQDSEGLPDPYIERIISFEDSSLLIATKEFGLFQLKKESTVAKQLPWPGDKLRRSFCKSPAFYFYLGR